MPCRAVPCHAAGDQDLICNWLGNRRWVDGLQWEGAEGWSQAQDKPWSVKGQQAGLVTSYNTLSFVKVFQAVSYGSMMQLDGWLTWCAGCCARMTKLNAGGDRSVSGSSSSLVTVSTCF